MGNRPHSSTDRIDIQKWQVSERSAEKAVRVKEVLGRG
jgi:hypothetical protein